MAVGMKFAAPLVPARLIRRYKRFLADCTLEDGREVTAHCANPGSMMGLAEPGERIWLEPNDDPKKKLKFAVFRKKKKSAHVMSWKRFAARQHQLRKSSTKTSLTISARRLKKRADGSRNNVLPRRNPRARQRTRRAAAKVS